MRKTLVAALFLLVGCSDARARQRDADGLRHLAAAPVGATSGYEAGMQSLQGDELGAAQAAFELAVRLDPTVGEYRYHLGKVYWRRNQRDLALQQFRIAAGLDNASPEAARFLRELQEADRDAAAQQIAEAVADRLARQ